MACVVVRVVVAEEEVTEKNFPVKKVVVVAEEVEMKVVLMNHCYYHCYLKVGEED